MKLGIQYFRDPNPPEECWAQDMADIAAAGFSFIGCWLPWRYVNPAEGEWDLARYRKLFDLAHHRGLSVRCQLITESAPDWVVRQHPDSLIVNGYGQPVYLHPHPMLQLGGWPGVNLAHPVARRLADDYITQVVGRLKDHPAVLTWNIWNEIQYPMSSHDAHTQAAFRQWLAKRYGDITACNHARHTQFASFEEIRLPNRTLEGCEMVLSRAAEFEEFFRDVIVCEAARRAALVRAADPVHPVSLHTNSNSPFDPQREMWGVAEAADIAGNSTYNVDPFYDRMSCLKQRSVKPAGRWWLTEHAGGRMVYYYGHRTYEGRELVNDALRALAHGAGAASFWQYRCEFVEQEAPNFGLLNQDGSLSSRYRAIADAAGRLQAWDAAALEYAPAEVGMLVEPLDVIFRTCSDSWMNQVWQEHREFESWLRALLYAGWSPDFLLARRLVDHAIPVAIKVILAPSLVVLRDGVAERLAAWVKNGGHLIVGPFTGVFNPAGVAFRKTPGGALQDLFGLWVRDRVSGDRFPMSAMTPRKEILRGRHLFEAIETTPGTATLLETDGKPAALRRASGKGSATYLASFTGPESEASGSLLCDWLRGTLTAFGLARPMEVEGPVWGNTCRSGARRVVFLENPADKECVAAVTAQSGTVLEDVISGETFAADPIARVRLGPRQVRMLVA